MFVSRQYPYCSPNVYYSSLQTGDAPASDSLAIVVVGIGLVGLATLMIAELFAEGSRTRVIPLERWKKEYVFRRDGRHCRYCGLRVTRRTSHVDHRVSRANGGTNHLNNLSLSCCRCNLSKGPLNARQFVRMCY